MSATGTKNPDFADGIMCHVAHVSLEEAEKNNKKVNFALSVVTGDAPRDQEEAMLGVFKAAIYLAGIKMAVHLQNAQTIMEADLAERSLNNCARTFAKLVEARARKRSGSEQNIVVQNNVSVNDNAQAVVGNVTGQRGKDGQKENEGQ